MQSLDGEGDRPSVGREQAAKSNRNSNRKSNRKLRISKKE